MVDSEDFGEEDTAPKRVPPSASDKRTSPRGRQETSSQHNKGKRGRKERENDWRFFCFFFVSFFKLFLTKVFFSRYKKFFPYSKR